MPTLNIYFIKGQVSVGMERKFSCMKNVQKLPLGENESVVWISLMLSEKLD